MEIELVELNILMSLNISDFSVRIGTHDVEYIK